MFRKANPKTFYGGLGVGTTSGAIPYIAGKVAEGTGNLGLQIADLAVSDKYFDQDKVIGGNVKEVFGKVKKALGFEEDKVPPPGKTPPGKVIPKEKTPAEIKVAKEKQLNKIYELLGVNRAKKNAASKALIDMSRYIDEQGKEAISKKNLGSTISKAIGAFDKRLDKVDQLKEASGLMLAKAEVENMMDPLGQESKRMSIALAKDKLYPGVNSALTQAKTIKKGPLSEQETVDAVRSGAANEGLELIEAISSDQIDDGNYKGKTVIDIVTDLQPEDGYYVIGKSIIKVESGVPQLKEGPLTID